MNAAAHPAGMVSGFGWGIDRRRCFDLSPASLNPGRTVLSRALAILSAFSYRHPTRTLTDISREADIPLPTAHRLTAELVNWGALDRDERGQYQIGLRLWELVVVASRSVDLRDTAMPFLGDVYAATGQNVLLGVLDRAEALYIERISGPKSVHLDSLAGTRMPLHASGIGLVLLAHAPWSLRQKVLNSPLPALTSYTLTDPDALRRALAEVREQGYVISARQIDETATSIAAPLFGPSGAVVAALSLVVPASADTRPLVPALVTAARGLSRALGAQAP